MKIESTEDQGDLANLSGNTCTVEELRIQLTEDQSMRLQKRLYGIDVSDPLNYRRDALSHKLVESPHLFSQGDLRSIADLQNILYEPVFTSHRKILGPPIIMWKRLVHRFMKKWLGILLARQFELNQRMFNLAMTVVVLENRVRNLEKLAKDRL